MKLIAQLFSYLYYFFPRKIQMGLGSLLGRILLMLGFRVKIAQQNLAYAFPKDLLKQREILQQSYQHFGNLILEIFLVLGPLRKFVLNQVDLVGEENWKKAHDLGKGVIFLSSHVGNWEMMAAAGGLCTPMDLMLVTKQVKPNWLHQAIESGRKKCRVKATYEPRTAKDVLSHLKNKKTVGFVLDQYAGPPVGVRVPLFGHPVGTSLVVAAFAKRTGAPVVPVVNYRLPSGRWVVQIRPAIEWQTHSESHYELAANTARYVQEVEGDILAHPEQWLWVHRRFKGDLGALREGEWSSPRVRA